MQQQIQEKKVKLDKERQETEQNKKGIEEKIRDHLSGIKQAHVDAVNKILENLSPTELTDALEAFVAILRNKPIAMTNAPDVMLFFTDYKKLVAQMERTEAVNCSVDVINECLAKL